MPPSRGRIVESRRTAGAERDAAVGGDDGPGAVRVDPRLGGDVDPFVHRAEDGDGDALLVDLPRHVGAVHRHAVHQLAEAHMLPARHQRVFALETDLQLTAAYHPIHLRIPGAQVGSADRLEADAAPFLGLEPRRRSAR